MNEVEKLVIEAVTLANNDKYEQADNVIQSVLSDKSHLDKLTAHNWQFIGHLCLLMGKFELSQNAYVKGNNFVSAVFVLILMNKLEEARVLLKKTPASSASFWCTFLIDLFSQNVIIKKYPSFFMIRHYMEFTVYNLLLSNNSLFIQLLLKNLNKLLSINLDAEKLIGYAYFHFGKFDEAIKFLMNSLKRDQYDGELYFNLGQIYYMKNNFYESLSMLTNAQLLLPDHYATKLLIKKVQSKLLD